jgi:cysteine desulfurase
VIYADNAATTRISDAALEQMLPFLREAYGNPSSRHSLGAGARRAVERARGQVAEAMGAEPSEIIFTSGGSEANGWLLRGMADVFRNEPIHIITTSIEHHSVLNACRAIEGTCAEVTYLPVDGAGRVAPGDVEAAIRPNTKLATIMLVNNEIGTIQPLVEIAQLLKARGILLHADAVQAVGHVPVDVRDLQIDFLTASAHKFNGAKGTGILFRRQGLGLPPLILGGGQEHGLRAGTENVAGIVAAGYALAESVAAMGETAARLNAMADATVRGVLAGIPTARVMGDAANRLPGLVNLVLEGVSGESMMHLLDLKGICVSTSAACASGDTRPSHVLLALGLTDAEAKSSIRISYGRYNAAEDAEAVASAVCRAYGKIRAGPSGGDGNSP